MASEAGSHDEGVVDAGLCRRKPTPDPGPQQSAPKWGLARPLTGVLTHGQERAALRFKPCVRSRWSSTIPTTSRCRTGPESHHSPWPPEPLCQQAISTPPPRFRLI
jgi:hypothetical protein